MWCCSLYQGGCRLYILFLLLSALGQYAYGDDKGVGEFDFERKLFLYDLYQPFEFDCALNKDTFIMQYQWSINGTEASADREGVEFKENGAVLRVTRGLEGDFGNYTCRIGNVVAFAWRAEAIPHARLRGNTNELVIGEDFEIICELIGMPYEAVTWLFTSSVGTVAKVDVSNGTRFSVRDSSNGVPRGVLVGRQGEVSDSGVYTCVPPRYGLPASTMLRVMEVSPALWILTGFGACLSIILVAIIVLSIVKKKSLFTNKQYSICLTL